MKKFSLALLVTAFSMLSVNAQTKVATWKFSNAVSAAGFLKAGFVDDDLMTKSREMVIDDAFTFFDAVPVEEYSQQNRGNVDVGWTPKVSFRLFGTFPSRSGFSVVISQAGKQAAKMRCDAYIYQKAKDVNLRGPRQGIDLNFDNFMRTSGCWNKRWVIKETGKFDVQVFARNGDTDEKTLVRTYRIDVRRAPRVRGSATNPQADVAHYYVSRHGDVSASVLQLVYAGITDYFFTYDSSPPGENRVHVIFSYSPKRTTDILGQAYARCFVNGKKLDLPGPSPYADVVNFQTIRREVAIYTDRKAAKYKRGSAYKDEVAFNVVRATLPLSFGNRNTNRLKMEDYPGDWKCDVLKDGEKIRTFSWKVGSDGKLVPHPEQANGNTNLYYRAILVDTEIPAGGSEYDHRLKPGAAEGFFYGVPWKTPRGKAMAAKVPKKGNAFHVPSN